VAGTDSGIGVGIGDDIAGGAADGVGTGGAELLTSLLRMIFNRCSAASSKASILDRRDWKYSTSRSMLFGSSVGYRMALSPMYIPVPTSLRSRFEPPECVAKRVLVVVEHRNHDHMHGAFREIFGQCAVQHRCFLC